jgi:hypothetical protein
VRRWLAIVLALAMLPWQAAGWAASVLSDINSAEQRHMAAHWAGEAHHHHHDAHDDDGDGLHHDDSEESLRHAIQSDAHLNAVAVVPDVLGWLSPSPLASVPDALPSLPGPSPFLEGPRRPPRS